ncbi:MAG TPA: hypothetical protein VF069_24675 [Streptosporangiaceae bacterium]
MTHAVITLYQDVPDGELDELVRLLDDAGLDAEVGPAQARMGSLRDTALQMVIQGPIDVIIAALTTAAGKRAWRFVTGLVDRHRGRPPAGLPGRDGDGDGPAGREVIAVIVDQDGAVRIELSRPDLREAALESLPARLGGRPADRHPDRQPDRHLDQPGVVVRWDGATGTWQVSVAAREG